MSNSKLEAIMADLHQELANQLLTEVQSGETSASILNVARQFLKDNGVDGVPTQGNPLDNLIHALPDFNEDELPTNH
mgnify:FL=1|jgi:hypothetical protein|tara:strand:+ start:426 stop:656 length:231 start_codon:yes stop_codon:yes gene_type:complete